MMSIEWLAELGWKSLLLAAVTLALLALAKNRSAAEKSLVGDAGIVSLLLLPATILWLPKFELAAPLAVGAAVEGLATGATASNAAPDAALVAQAAAGVDWNALALALYLVPLAVLVIGLAWGLLGLRRLYRRARVLEDGRWLTALATAQNRAGLKHGTALLVSNEINSPISWGVVRPVIMIDAEARNAADGAEAIIAHELAHVQRLDWLKLIVARLVVALFWFNPLVWLLSRRCHQLREEAADDAVLRTRFAKTTYASLLLTAVRHANRGPLLAANGVAPSTSSIAMRVSHVLDAGRPRRAAPVQWAAGIFALALAANAALAAAEPVLQRSWGTDPGAGERASVELATLPGLHARALADAIRNRDWSARRVQGDTRFNEPRAVRPLLLALRDDHSEVRRIAVWGLSEMRPSPAPLATPAVSRLLYDPSAAVRAEAAGAIGEFGVKNSGSVEKMLLTDPSTQVRLRAAHALGDIQDPNSRATLELALGDADPEVRAKARWALGRVAEAEKIMNR